MSFANNEQVAYFSGGTPETSVDTTPHAKGLLGRIVTLNTGTSAAPIWKRYQYVKASGAIPRENAVEWTGSTTVGSTVQKGSVVEGFNFYFAGVSASTSAITDGQYFWIVLPDPGITFYAEIATAGSGGDITALNYWNLSSGAFRSVVISGTVHVSNTASTISTGMTPRLLAVNLSSIASTAATNSSYNLSRPFMFVRL